MKLVNIALFASAAMLALAAGADTLTWTGGGGDSRWTNPANWSGASSGTDFSAAHDYVFNNLADGANIKLSKYNNAPVTIKSLTMNSSTARNWTFSGVDSTARMRTLSTGKISISADCSLTVSVQADNPWNDKYNGFTLDGGGLLRLSANWSSWGGTIYVNNATLVNANNLSNSADGLGSVYVKLQSDRAVYRIENKSFSRMQSNSAGTTPVFDLTDSQYVNNTMANVTFSGFMTGLASSSFGSYYPHAFTFTSSPAMNGTYTVYNGNIVFGSATSPVNISSEASLDVRQNAGVYLYSDQTISVLKGDGATGTVNIPAGRTLTVAGAMGAITGSVYHARLAGGGKLVKQGGAYDLTLTGDSESFTGSVEVAEGKLILGDGGRYLEDDIVFYAPFDSNGWDSEMLGGEKFGGYVLDWGTTPYTYIDFPERSIGDGVFGDSIRLMSSADVGCRWRFGTDKAQGKKINRGNWTMSIWIKPEADSGTGTRNGHFFNFGSWADSGLEYVLALIQFEYSNSKKLCRVRDYSNNVVTPNIPELVDGNWHHVVYVQEPRAKFLWVDGVLRAQKTDFAKDIYIGSADIQIGGKDNWKNSTFRGLLDELIVANGSWSEERILNEYRRCHIPGSADAKPLPKPAARWTFDEDFTDSEGGVELVNGGTVEATLASVAGASGKCLDLRKNRYLKLKATSYPSSLPVGKKPFTFAIRQRFNGAAEYTDSFSMGDVSAVDRYFGAGIYNASRTPCLYWKKFKDKTVSVAFRTAPNNSPGDTNPLGWDHLIATYDGTNVVSYIDGRLNATTSATTLDIRGGAVYFGYDPYPAASDATNFVGYVDDVTIWTNRCMSAAECREVVRSFGRDYRKVGQLVNAPVSVRAGATLQAEGVGNEVMALSGDGIVNVMRNSAIKIGSADFRGTLSGSGIVEVRSGAALSASDASRFNGRLRLAGGVSVLNSSYSACTVELVSGGVTGGQAPVEVLDGATLAIDAAAQDVAGVSTSAELTLPEEATVVIDGVEPEGDMLIAEAGSLKPPSDFSKWHLPGAAGRYRLRVRDNRLYLVIRRGIAVIYF